MNSINTNTNTFEKHPIITILFVNILFLFVWICIDLVYSNFISSFTHTYEVFKSVKPIGHVNVENKTFRWVSRYSGEYDAEVKFNNLGFRNNEDYNEQIIEGKKVVFALGDSTTASLENSYENSYPKVLNNLLGDKYIVFNTGVRGFDTNQVIINYKTRLEKLKPDLLIYMICENDLNGNIDPELYPSIIRYYGKGIINDDGSYKFIEPVSGFEKLKIEMKIGMAKNLQLTFKYIFMPLASFIKRVNKHSSREKNYFDTRELNKLEELLLRLNKIALEDNIPLYITWFPYLKYADESNTQIPMHYKKIQKFVDQNLSNAYFISTYEPLIEYYKNNPSNETTSFLFPYNLHATDFGSVKLGTLIAEELQKRINK